VPRASRRAHTGSRRNEQVRQAVLGAALDLLMGSDDTSITMDALAARASVSKQTIYRWWPTKAAVLAEAMADRARDAVPVVDSGTVLGDLTEFLIATFRNARARPVARALRTVMAEAQSDPQAAEVLHAYTAERREALRAVLIRGQQRGDLPSGADITTMVDMAFGFVWYRMMVGHAPLDRSSAVKLARSVLGG
jgi:AcrR family transcriptional regulator